MATIAEPFSVKDGSAKPPLSTHPAFPAIVALWFSALIGLGSLVLPVALLERLVTMTGIASLVSSAAPPLGFTARAVIALSGSIAGAIVGLMLARKIARSQSPEPKARFVDEAARPRRPISAHEELGDEGLASATDGLRPLVHKRRSLAMSEGDARSMFLEPAPLPGQAQFASVEPAEVADDETVLEEALEDTPSQPLELGEFASLNDDEEASGTVSDSAMEALRSRFHTSEDSQEDSMSEPTPFNEPNGGDEPDSFGTAESSDGDGYPEASREPLPFAAPSLRRDQPAFLEPGENEEDEFAPVREDQGLQLSIVPHSDEAPDDGHSVDDGPLEDLGLVQLAARLGASLKKRMAQQATSVEASLSQAAVGLATAEEFEAAGAEDAARAIADFFAPAGSPEPQAEPTRTPVEASSTPTALRSFAFDNDEEDDDDLAASFRLPLTGTNSDDPFAAEAAEDEFDELDEDDAEYSSLLAMKNPFARPQEFVRVEEPEPESDAIEPAVTFPSDASSQRPFDPPLNAANPAPAAAPRDPGDAERSLRDALATLQRMSGAA